MHVDCLTAGEISTCIKVTDVPVHTISEGSRGALKQFYDTSSRREPLPSIPIIS